MKLARVVTAALGLGVLVASTAGCPSSMCLLTVNGVCQYSNCGDGEHFDQRTRLCTCNSDRRLIGGACRTRAQADLWCGKGATWTPTGCAARTCAPGLVLDQDSDQCVPKQAIDQAAGVAAGQTLGCAAGTVLVVSQGAGSCIPVAQSCAKDEVFDGQACRKVPACNQGAEYDPASRQCIQVVAAPPSSNDALPTVDVAAWSRTSYGPDGGDGSSGLCGPLAKKPVAFQVLPGGSIRVKITLDLNFAQPATESGSVATVAIVDGTGQPVAAKGATEVQSAADTLFQTLRTQHARASVPHVTTTVKCLIVNAAPPTSVPSTGGA